ncbi:MAG: glutaredoxin family protein [Luteimonas sp.]
MSLFYSSGQVVVAMRLKLYQRDDCPLCDEALAVLAAARVPDFDSVWIDDDDVLETRYGTRVPVLRDEASGTELDWPFDGAMLGQFISARVP